MDPYPHPHPPVTVGAVGTLKSCSRCTSSSSAGAYPRPFCVKTCTTMGPPHSAAWANACSMCSMLCPSIGPAYRTPNASKKVCGATISRRALVNECTLEYASSPKSRQLTQAQPQPLSGRRVRRVQSQRRQRLRQLRHRRRVRPAIVVQHDHDLAVGMPEIVQRLVRHPPGQRPVTDDSDHPALAIDAAQGEPRGDPVRVRQRRRRVGVLNPVVLGLRPVRVAGQPAGLSQVLEAVPAPGQHLVHVGLVARVPEEDVTGRVEDPVQRQRELDRPQVRPQVPTGGRHRVDDESPYLFAQLSQLFAGQGLDVGRSLDTLQNHDGWRHVTRCPRPAAVATAAPVVAVRDLV